MRALLEVAYSFGFRLGELRTMRCRQVNLLTGVISLETSKNGEPREAYMTAGIRQLLTALVAGKEPDNCVFTRDAGQKVGDFRKTWAGCSYGRVWVHSIAHTATNVSWPTDIVAGVAAVRNPPN